MSRKKHRVHTASKDNQMKRKARDYSYEIKPIEPEHITMNELYGLTFEEMMEKANGVPKKDKTNEKENKQLSSIQARLRVR